MRKFIRTIIWLFLLFLGIAIALTTIWFWHLLEKTKSPPAPVSQTSRLVTPPPAEALGQGARPPTPLEIEQEKKFINDRAEKALVQLKSSDKRERLIATEQLNAYQSQKAEQQLMLTLRHDPDAEVRNSAARSLALYKELTPASFEALLAGLNDSDKATRYACLDVVLSFAEQQRANEFLFKRILIKMQRTAHSRHIEKAIKESLQAFINEKTPDVKAYTWPMTVKKAANTPSN